MTRNDTAQPVIAWGFLQGEGAAPIQVQGLSAGPCRTEPSEPVLTDSVLFMCLYRHWGNQTADARQAAELAKAEAAERAAEAEAVAKTSDRASAEAEAKTLQVGLYSLLLPALKYLHDPITASCTLRETDQTLAFSKQRFAWMLSWVGSHAFWCISWRIRQ